MRILVIEDDQTTASFIAKGFREAGILVDVFHDGNEALDRLLVYDYSAAVIDIMVPGLDGLSIIQALREEGNHTPALILSAKRSVSERIEGIRAGGDDYLVKPFSLSELIVRVQALVRRSNPPGGGDSTQSATPNTLTFADLELDPWKREAKRSGDTITLHPKEFSLLEYLMRNQERVVSKTAILENVYSYDFDPRTNVVDVLVYRLRNKIDKKYERKLIHTIRGMGYILRED